MLKNQLIRPRLKGSAAKSCDTIQRETVVCELFPYILCKRFSGLGKQNEWKGKPYRHGKQRRVLFASSFFNQDTTKTQRDKKGWGGSEEASPHCL